MKREYENIPLVKNEEKQRFEIEVDGHYSFIDYKEHADKISLIHTETDPELRGKGAASALVEKKLRYLDDNKILILPYCPFIFSYIKKNPDWKRIVCPDYDGYDKL